MNGTPDKSSGQQINLLSSCRIPEVLSEIHSELLNPYLYPQLRPGKSGVMNGTPDMTSGRQFKPPNLGRIPLIHTPIKPHYIIRANPCKSAKSVVYKKLDTQPLPDSRSPTPMIDCMTSGMKDDRTDNRWTVNNYC